MNWTAAVPSSYLRSPEANSGWLMEDQVTAAILRPDGRVMQEGPNS
jgi:hypothetical protein